VLKQMKAGCGHVVHMQELAARRALPQLVTSSMSPLERLLRSAGSMRAGREILQARSYHRDHTSWLAWQKSKVGHTAV
jgi:hypothetical protein